MSGFDGLLVDHGALEAASNDLARGVKDIENRMSALESELNPLRSDWAGTAQQSYTVAKAKWDGAIAEMQNILSQTSTQVLSSNSDYVNADNRGARSFEIG
jgi:early secretory antigenic target protein ESAT-6